MIDIDWEWLSSLPFIREEHGFIIHNRGMLKSVELESYFGTVEIPFDSEEQLTKKYIETEYLKAIKRLVRLVKKNAEFYSKAYESMKGGRG